MVLLYQKGVTGLRSCQQVRDPCTSHFPKPLARGEELLLRGSKIVEHPLQPGPLRIDLKARALSAAGNPLHLSAARFTILLKASA